MSNDDIKYMNDKMAFYVNFRIELLISKIFVSQKMFKVKYNRKSLK